jgi:hypothetical protein
MEVLMLALFAFVAANLVLATYVYAFAVQPTPEVRVAVWALQDRELR